MSSSTAEIVDEAQRWLDICLSRSSSWDELWEMGSSVFDELCSLTLQQVQATLDDRRKYLRSQPEPQQDALQAQSGRLAVLNSELNEDYGLMAHLSQGFFREGELPPPATWVGAYIGRQGWLSLVFLCPTEVLEIVDVCMAQNPDASLKWLSDIPAEEWPA